jgi:hypothetical protein
LTGPGWLLPERAEDDRAFSLNALLTSPKPLRESPSNVRQRTKKPAGQQHSAPVQKTPSATELTPEITPEITPIASTDQPSALTSNATQTAASADSPPSPNGLPSDNPLAENAANEPPAVAPPAPNPVRIDLPDKGRVRYVISRGTNGFVIGQAIYTWQHDGLNYTMQSVTETTGLIALFKKVRVVQTSQGEITAAGIRPHEFRNERANGVDSASFDWLRRIVSYDGRESPVADDTQDMLSMYCQLVLLVPKGGNLEMPIATGRKLENYRFERIGEDVVQLGERQYPAIHLQTRNGKDTIEAWIAPEIHGLPLKIRFIDRNGEIFDQQAQDIDVASLR